MLAKTSTIAGVVLAALFAARADAQPEPDPDARPPDAAPGDAGADRLTLQKGRLLLNGFVEINLSTDLVGKPISLSPDLWYGITDDITAGLVHSGVGLSGFMGAANNSLCLTGTENGCGDFYPDVGFIGRYRLKLGGIAAAAEGGLIINHLSDPIGLGIKLGGIGRWHSGPLAVEAEPSLFIGLTNRDSATVNGVVIAGNRDVLGLPVTALYAITPMISAALQSGFVLPLEDTADVFTIPLSLGGFYRVNADLTVNLAFSLPLLVGGSAVKTGFDARTLTLGGTYAF
jgi:hypothetical protein